MIDAIFWVTLFGAVAGLIALLMLSSEEDEEQTQNNEILYTALILAFAVTAVLFAVSFVGALKMSAWTL